MGLAFTGIILRRYLIQKPGVKTVDVAGKGTVYILEHAGFQHEFSFDLRFRKAQGDTSNNVTLEVKLNELLGNACNDPDFVDKEAELFQSVLAETRHDNHLIVERYGISLSGRYEAPVRYITVEFQTHKKGKSIDASKMTPTYQKSIDLLHTLAIDYLGRIMI